MKHKTRIYFDDFVNAVHNCDRRSQFCERRSQFSIVNVGATPRNKDLKNGMIAEFLIAFRVIRLIHGMKDSLEEANELLHENLTEELHGSSDAFLQKNNIFKP
jgi:hypothetical protein